MSAKPSDRPAFSDEIDVDGDARGWNEPSLADDVMAFVSDGRNYAEAELRYQKSRAAYAANRLKYAAAYGAAAFGFLHLALIAITVGAVITLAPIIGALLATIIVGVVLIVAGVFFLRALKSKIDDVRAAFGDDPS